MRYMSITNRIKKSEVVSAKCEVRSKCEVVSAKCEVRNKCEVVSP